MRKEQVVFQGLTFTRYPESRRRHHRVYYWPTKTWRDRGVGALHVEIWRAAHGDVPEGSHVHHANGDPLDNRLDNLTVMGGTEHARLHAAGGWGRTDAEHLGRIRELAKDWHRSEEGRAWHREQAKAQWVGRESQDVGPCAGCGEPARSKVGFRKDGRNFCSNRCWQRTAYAEGRYASYLHDAVCPECGTPFKQRKNGVPATCSRSCGAVLRQKKKRLASD